MRKKDELAIDKIIECAKREFSEKSFEGASMRNIAENAGYTTGMLYGRFADKGELFKAIVSGVADGFIFFLLRLKAILPCLHQKISIKTCTDTSIKKWKKCSVSFTIISTFSN